MQGRKAIYPGTFDPVTYGHLDVIRRAARLFDTLIVAIATNVEKHPLLSLEELTEALRNVVAQDGLNNVEVTSFSGMAVDFVRMRGSRVLVRGIRTMSDWEAEFQMALTNRALNNEIETVFVMASLEYSYVSSRLIREVASLGGDVSKFLPPAVEKVLKRKLAEARKDRSPS